MRLALGVLLSVIAAAALPIVLPAAAQSVPPRAPAAFAKCTGCHAAAAGRASPLGPNLFGVAGRVSGTAPRAMYSPAMRRAAITWNAVSLDAFIADPRARVPGTTMQAIPEKNPAVRREIVAYLLSLK